MRSCPHNEKIKIICKDIPLCEDFQNVSNTIKDKSYTDLYVVGKFWIDALSTGLVGDKVNIIPVLKADEVPKKTKYKDLPIYQGANDNETEENTEVKVKLLHKLLLPYVTYYRKAVEKNICHIKCSIINQFEELKDANYKANEEFKATMRDPDNIVVRKGVLTTSGLVGYWIGCNGGVIRRIFFTSIGLLSAGALCFPKETDENFRNVLFYSSKAFLTVYKTLTGKEIRFREKLPCKDEMPPVVERKLMQCPRNK